MDLKHYFTTDFGAIARCQRNMNLILDTARSFCHKRPISKIVSFARERKAPGNMGIAEIQSAVQMNVMVKHMRRLILDFLSAPPLPENKLTCWLASNENQRLTRRRNHTERRIARQLSGNSINEDVSDFD